MPGLRDNTRRMWAALNPREPSAWYLAKLMAAMIAAFVIGLLIGPR